MQRLILIVFTGIYAQTQSIYTGSIRECQPSILGDEIFHGLVPAGLVPSENVENEIVQEIVQAINETEVTTPPMVKPDLGMKDIPLLQPT